MKSKLLFAASVAALVAATGAARANILLYNFEASDPSGPTDGFTKNGAITVSATSTGATVGTGALNLVDHGTYTGAYTTDPTSLAELDNPSIDAITVDVYNQTTYAGNFADMGVTIFISNTTTGDYGENFTPSTALFANVDYPQGTETTVTIPLLGPDPVTGATVPFSAVLAEGYVPTEFQLTLSSDASATTPLTIDVDNVEAVTPVPEPASLGALAVGGLLLARRRHWR